MKSFKFEKDLKHQSKAVESTVAVFDDLTINKATEEEKNFINPHINSFLYGSVGGYLGNIKKIQKENQIKNDSCDRHSNIIDIMMETGTGKTYTYTKTIFELNKKFNIFKFIVVVPTLSIKAGTIEFLQSDSAREHFKEQYSKTIKLHIVESQKGNKKKKILIPATVSDFVNAGDFEKNHIQVMIINAGMINSDTMQKSFDTSFFDKYAVPFEAISATKPFLIIDEPHKFAKANKTWINIKKMNPQFILRYGATFPDKVTKKKDWQGKMEKIISKDYHNLIYTLTAVDAFNNNLVKGIIGHVTEFKDGENAIVRLVSSDGKEANFELKQNSKSKSQKFKVNESLETLHSAMNNLTIENINKSKVVLSNGLELKKDDKFNPYSYEEKLQEIMIKKAIKSHFVLEKELLSKDIKIKPLTLFFIDNIEEYRSEDGYIKQTVEKLIKAEIKVLLQEEKNTFYKQYLKASLNDISKTHGGYFSKDNSDNDEAIEKQVQEILHDKQSILDLANPRRFIFSKWTLREGWDNPNVFQICKLRSSGSEISKLQEVGRGLRLPVNEYGNRVKEDLFYLNYFVDFTENDFVDKLVNEINDKSDVISIDKIETKLTERLLQKICDIYKEDENYLLDKLDEKNLLKRNNDFKERGFEYIKKHYPLIFNGVNSNKVRKSTSNTKKVIVRTEKYKELKELWEKLNEKVILEYKFNNENEFKELFMNFLNEQTLSEDSIKDKLSKIEIKDDQAVLTEKYSTANNEYLSIPTIKYSEFIKELACILNINLKTIHNAFIESNININPYLNNSTIRTIKQNFDDFLMYNAIDKFSIEYKKVKNSIHPTKLTDSKGEVLKEINATDIGILHSDEGVADNYIFDELFYDSDLEKTNIQTNISEVIIFSKIPKNSIKIPVAGGKSYSPDFAYVLNYNNGEKKLHFIVETKNTNKDSLKKEELQKIKHAEKLFGNTIKINFKTQFSNDNIIDLIQEINN